MKPYLYAPVLIAGLFTLAGTATVATSELNLFQAGQQVASRFEIRSRDSVDLDSRQLDAMNFQKDSADQLKDEMRLDRLASTADEATPAPDVDIKASPADDVEGSPVAGECPKERAREVRRRARRTQEARTTLVSHYSYTIPEVPTLPKDATKIYIKADKTMPVVRLAGLNIAGKDGATMQFVFNSKEFKDQQKQFAEAFGKASMAEWKKDEALKKLPMYHVAVGGAGNIPQVITIDPEKLSKDAEKWSEDVQGAASEDHDSMIATPSH